jgi:hypothetical protein
VKRLLPGSARLQPGSGLPLLALLSVLFDEGEKRKRRAGLEPGGPRGEEE